MRRLILTAASCGAAAIVAGCVSYKQQVTFESDGSGRVVVDAWVDHFDVAEEESQTASAQNAPEINQGLGPAFAGLDGVTVEENWVKVEGEEDERREHTRLVLAFDKVENLAGHGVFEKQELSFQKNDGEFAFTQTIRTGRKKERQEYTKESEELARSLFEGYTFTYAVVMPGRVVDTNGTLGEDGRTVTWEWPLYDFSNQDVIVMTAASRE
ncbi:MAG: hypothetical protein GTN49_02080 [candidate division Zixibacteria bacterium]|nr:hypothetical protein [candidate division Zixibacteria bacterium]